MSKVFDPILAQEGLVSVIVYRISTVEGRLIVAHHPMNTQERQLANSPYIQ
jgi:hypothetical protein